MAARAGMISSIARAKPNGDEESPRHLLEGDISRSLLPSARFSSTVLPVTVIGLPCSSPASRSRFMTVGPPRGSRRLPAHQLCAGRPSSCGMSRLSRASCPQPPQYRPSSGAVQPESCGTSSPSPCRRGHVELSGTPSATTSLVERPGRVLLPVMPGRWTLQVLWVQHHRSFGR